MISRKLAFNAISGALVLAAIMLFAGCLSPFDPPNIGPRGTSGGMGNVTVSVDGEDSARTIQPKTIQSQFAQYKLEFVSSTGPTPVTLFRDNTDLGEPIELPVGTWKLTVTAYIQWDSETDNLPAAKGVKEDIEIVAGANEPLGLDLEAIADEGEGTFSWTITYPDNVTATMTITPLTDGTDEQEITLEGTPAEDPKYVVSQDSITLESGSYRVVFNMKKYDKEDKLESEIERRDILQVYQNMDSPFEASFLEQYFNITKVTGVTQTNLSVNTNVKLRLDGEVVPTTATFTDIVWRVYEDIGESGVPTKAQIKTDKDGPYLLAPLNGEVIVRATVEHGWGFGVNAFYNFTITVNYVAVTNMERVGGPGRDVNDGEKIELLVYLEVPTATNKNVTASWVTTNAPPLVGKVEITIEPDDFVIIENDKIIAITDIPDFVIGENDEIYTRLTVEGKAPGAVRITVKSAGTPDLDVTFDVEINHVKVESITLNINEMELSVGGRATLIPLIAPLNATNKNVSWALESPSTSLSVTRNDDNTGAVVINSGAINGSYIVVAKCADNPTEKVATCQINIVNVSDVTAVTGVTLNTATLNLITSDEVDLIAILAPFTSTNKDVIWKSSDPNVVTVPEPDFEWEGNGELNEDNGTVSIPVTAVGPGSAIVIATSLSGGRTAQCTVTVRDAPADTPVTGIAMSIPAVRVNVGAARDLYASILPFEAGNKKVTWTSSNTAVATVSSAAGSGPDATYGYRDVALTGVTSGTVTIMATTEDNGETAVCEVTVVPADTVKVSGVTLNLNTLRLLTTTGSATLVATVAPADADDTVVWWSSNPAVATVDAASGLITGIEAGVAQIRTTTADGNFTAYCDVTVRGTGDSNYVYGLSLDTTSFAEWYLMTRKLIPTLSVAPADSTPTYPTLVWSSSDPSIASVDQTGLVTMVWPGTATITVYSEDGAYKATCAVEVKKVDVTGVTLSIVGTTTSPLSLSNSGQVTLLATVQPWNATIKSVKWSSSNTDRATIPVLSATLNGNDSTGIVRGAGGNGNVTITVTTDDMNKTANCIITTRSAGNEVSSVTLNTYELELELDKEAILTAAIQPIAAADEVFWYSDNTTIATVTRSGAATARTGAVKGIAVGTANIYATSLRTGIMTRASKVTVREASEAVPPAGGIELNINGITMTTTAGNRTSTLAAMVTPRSAENVPLAANPKVVWSTSNPAFATVDYDTGLITAVANGAVTITATTVDAGKTANCTVTVQAIAVPVTGNNMNMLELTLKIGSRADWATRNMVATLAPSNATDGTIFWYSSNRTVATVDQNGKVDRVGVGEATIYATAVNSGRNANSLVRVLDANPNLLQPVERINLSSSVMTVWDFSTSPLTATVVGYSSGSTVVNNAITWSSSNSAVAIMDGETGIVTAVGKPGTTATITATSQDGARVANCTVTVGYGFSNIPGQNIRMGTTTVTQDMWLYVMTPVQNNLSATPSSFASSPTAGEIQGRRPVEQVSWYDAIIFCNRLSVLNGLTPVYSINGSTDTTTWGNVPTSNNTTWNNVTIVAGDGYRLPTEAQWEYACRGGQVTGYSFYFRLLGGGDASASNTWNANYGWTSAEANSRTHEVGLKWRNGYDLYDMHGNVWEWVQDWYPGSVGTYRVVRGGSWNGSSSNATSSNRGGNSPYYRYYYIGLRLVRP